VNNTSILTVLFFAPKKLGAPNFSPHLAHLVRTAQAKAPKTYIILWWCISLLYVDFASKFCARSRTKSKASTAIYL